MLIPEAGDVWGEEQASGLYAAQQGSYQSDACNALVLLNRSHAMLSDFISHLGIQEGTTSPSLVMQAAS